MDRDLRAVLDTVGSERAAVYAELDAGPVGMIFAATHLERTRKGADEFAQRAAAEGDLGKTGAILLVR